MRTTIGLSGSQPVTDGSKASQGWTKTLKDVALVIIVIWGPVVGMGLIALSRFSMSLVGNDFVR
jgi:hypothetical protein